MLLRCPVYVLEAVLRIFPPWCRREPALASLRVPKPCTCGTEAKCFTYEAEGRCLPS